MSTLKLRETAVNSYKLVARPITSYQHWGLVAITALAFLAIPLRWPYTDWKLITDEIILGLDIYADPNSVYPPWSLILLWPYYFMTASGARAVSVLVISWLAAREKWSLLKFWAVIASPFFLWTMLLSNLDVLALLFPILLWEKSEGEKWQWLGRGLGLAILLIKPQGGGLIILYFLYQNRHALGTLFWPLVLTAIIIIPVSLVGQPPLVWQWLDNIIFNPSAVNRSYWAINNVSLTTFLGRLPGIFIVLVTLGGVYTLRKTFNKPWTQNHTYASLFFLAMFLGPYTSNQSLIVPLALLVSWPALLLQYLATQALSHFDLYIKYGAVWALCFGISALWFYAPAHQRAQTGQEQVLPEAAHAEK